MCMWSTRYRKSGLNVINIIRDMDHEYMFVNNATFEYILELGNWWQLNCADNTYLQWKNKCICWYLTRSVMKRKLQKHNAVYNSLVLYKCIISISKQNKYLPKGRRWPSGIPATVWTLAGGNSTSVFKSFTKLVLHTTSEITVNSTTHNPTCNLSIFGLVYEPVTQNNNSNFDNKKNKTPERTEFY